MRNPLLEIIAEKGWCDAGLQVIGGCCGTSPTHVEAMVRALDSTVPRPFDVNAVTAVLGDAWVGLEISASDKMTDGRPTRRGRRRH